MKRIRDAIALTLATGFGAGVLLPVGQGTIGALLAMLFVPAFLRLDTPLRLALVAAGTLIALWSAGRAETHFGKKDDHRIIIDEIVSIFLTFTFIRGPIGLDVLAAGFVANRVLDWIKPWPAGLLQRRLAGGAGIVLDDLASGAYAALILGMILRY